MENLESAIEDQVNKIKPMVLAKVAGEDVNDVMQDIRLSFFTSFPHFRGESKLSTFAHIIAKRRIVDYFRKKYRDIRKRESLNKRIKETKTTSNIESLDGGYKVLTENQKIILKLLGKGLNNAEIAQTLNISMNTTRSHMKEIYRKFKHHDRVKLALFSYKFFKEEKKNEN